jgi:hypothetical protein
MNGQIVNGAHKQLQDLMGAATRGIKKMQTAPPGMKPRSVRDKKQIYNAIISMTPEERNVKLNDIASVVGQENLARFLLEMSRKK